MDDDLRLTVPLALLSSPEAAAGSSPDPQHLPGTPGFATPPSSPSLSCCVLSVTSDHPSPCTIFSSCLPFLLLVGILGAAAPLHPSMPQGWHRWQDPSSPIQAAANYAKAADGLVLCWAARAPLVAPWIERPCRGDLVCVCTTMEQKSTVSGTLSGKPTERGPPAMHITCPRPLRVDFN